MLRSIKYLLLSLCLLVMHQSAHAGITLQPLGFELTAMSPVYAQGAVMEFRLRIRNLDTAHTHPVLLPAPGYSGPRFIYLTAYAHALNENSFATEVVRVEGTGPADTNAALYTRHLKPGEFVDVSLKVYAQSRYNVLPSEVNWFPGPMGIGAYQFLAWYQPYNMYGGKALFMDSAQYNGQSNYCKVDVVTPAPLKGKTAQLNVCGDDCGFCKAIEKKRWGKVRRTMEGQLKASYKGGSIDMPTPTNRGNWMDQHRNVVYISPAPEAILSIFPGRWGRTVGFKSGDSVHYFHMTIQLGKIHRVRSRLQSLVYCMGNVKLFKTTNEDYVGLHNFRPAEGVKFYYGVD